MSRSRGVLASSRSTTPVQDQKFVRKRVGQLGGVEEARTSFPRWLDPPDKQVLDASTFNSKCSTLLAADTSKRQQASDETVVVYGRVKSRRKLGSMLWFIDLRSGGSVTQATINLRELQELQDSRDSPEILLNRLKSIRTGDWIAVTGLPHTARDGNPTVLAQALPQVISVSLQPIPESITNKALISRNRHVERIVDTSAIDPIVLRHHLIQTLRRVFEQLDFVEVSTPLLTAGTGGAVARPFCTKATELGDMKLNLRIAPELYLKRLMVGNMDKVYELGPAFRNEGIDLNHNPEFTICEFYQAMADLEHLITTTEAMFTAFQTTTERSRTQLRSVPDPKSLGLKPPYKRIDFVSTLEGAISTRLSGWKFPDLRSRNARDQLIAAATDFDISIPHESVSVPRVLDMLSSKLIESHIHEATWIMHHPECMSPLAKSFTPAGSTYPVSARAELFIRGQEYVNCYEEENSPIEQRRKFEEQLLARDHETPATIDEDYVKALEWGMPPTGGWGCGIDRLVMLFSGRDRIADVLPFGTLTNVAAMGTQL